MEKKIDMKQRFFEVSKIVIFLSICFVLLQCLSPMFLPKNNNADSGIKYENARGFYGERKNSIDILAFGNSDLYSAMNPLQLWKDHGMTSYVSAEPSQSIFDAYYLLKNALTCQKPQLVILEVDELFSGGEIDHLDNLINTTLKNEFPIFEYHSRWKTMDSNEIIDTSTHYDTVMDAKGYIFHRNVKKNKDGFSYMKNKNKNSMITNTTQTYLKKFIDLAHENGAEVMFMWVPSATTATATRHISIDKLAKKLDIPFIDFNTNQFDTDFNWNTDTRDGGNHLNYNGATKMTKYLGKYLSENYQLNDYRNDEAYSDWNDCYDRFMKENNLKENED